MNQIHRSVAAAVAAIVVIAAGGWFALISPQRHHAADLRSQAAAREVTNATTQSKIRTLSAQQQKVPGEQARAAEIAQELPATPALPAYIRTLVAAAKATGVDLVSISPASPLAIAAPAAAAAPAPAVPAATPSVTAPATHAPATSAVQIQGISVALQVVGSYFQIQQFVAQIEKFKRASLVTSLDLKPGKKLEANAATADTTAQPGGSSGAAASAPDWTTLNAAIAVNVFMTAPGALVPATVATTAPTAAATPSPSASH